MHSSWLVPSAGRQLEVHGAGVGADVDATVVSFVGGAVDSGAGVGTLGQGCQLHFPSRVIIALHIVSDLPMHSGWVMPAAEAQVGMQGLGSQGVVDGSRGEVVNTGGGRVVANVVSFVGGRVVSNGGGEGVGARVVGKVELGDGSGASGQV